MARNCFYSFHYKPDNARASQVRNIGVIEGNKPVSDNDWEAVTKGGDDAIKRWIASQMKGKTCAVVLAGTGTANRKWINHEIIKAWDDGLGVVCSRNLLLGSLNATTLPSKSLIILLKRRHPKRIGSKRRAEQSNDQKS